jgi:hypothetical protein
VIVVTDELVEAFDAATQFEGVDPTEIALGLVAVLAIVERAQAGRCQVDLPSFTGGAALFCELRHGHTGDHQSGPTRWREAGEPTKWRCNVTERCFREDGHAGRHGFAGQEPRPTSPNVSENHP